MEQPTAGEPLLHVGLPTTQASVVPLRTPHWAATLFFMAAAAIPPTHNISTNTIYNWRLFVNHYQLDALDTRVGWLYTTFVSLLEANIHLSEGL